ncbi:MAG: hypothetical protein FWH37_09315, partial [Candidatus Bathyarchaeota archaeon]|nr:hypothetical protein [Candidatus Termiticorpusculum sp.]
HVFYGAFKRQKLTVVSIPQLIVDLLQEGGVCTEAAKKLINKVEQHTISNNYNKNLTKTNANNLCPT